jgi:sulfur-carrier protein
MMTIKFFARIREQLDIAELHWPATASVADLIADLVRERGPRWGEVLEAPQVIVAVNQQVADRHSELADGDEVAFFPPVTGG